MAEIKKECVHSLFDTKFIKVFDLEYAAGRHYYESTRRSEDELVAVMSDKEFSEMCPDAVTCIIILKKREGEPVLLLTYEYRYPAGRYLLSPPAGLIDKTDKSASVPAVSAAVRETEEETGLKISSDDKVFPVAPILFSSPGMTDESNALVCMVLENADVSSLSSAGAVGTEMFDGFELIDKKEAAKLLRAGTDKYGNYFSVYTWCALMYFVSGMWEQ